MPGPNVQRKLLFAFLYETAKMAGMPFRRLVWATRHELGEKTGREHYHWLIGAEEWKPTLSDMFRLNALWDSFPKCGFSRNHQFDPRLNGVEYVTKCLSGSALRDSLGGDFYEGSKFALRDAEVTLSNALARSVGGIIYLTAARTGLRQEELRQLAWADLSLEADAPFVVVRESSAKNKKEERVCLVPEIVERLRSYRPSDFAPGGLVFPNGIPRASRLKVDAKRNGIEYRDESGRYADFHALRYTWATFLQRNDIPQRFAMKLMRHSDMKLTAKVYTDETQLPIYDAIKGLPWLMDHTQIRAQISGAAGQNVAQAGAASEGKYSAETPVNGGVCRALAQADAMGQMERAKGFET